MRFCPHVQLNSLSGTFCFFRIKKAATTIIFSKQLQYYNMSDCLALVDRTHFCKWKTRTWQKCSLCYHRLVLQPVCLPTWQPSHGCGPRLLERGVPRNKGRKAHEHAKRGIGDANVRSVDCHYCTENTNKKNGESVSGGTCEARRAPSESPWRGGNVAS